VKGGEQGYVQKEWLELGVREYAVGSIWWAELGLFLLKEGKGETSTGKGDFIRCTEEGGFITMSGGDQLSRQKD